VRVALFVTCVNDTLFPAAGRATVTLLERLGCTVEFPIEQTCCGQMHLNSGYRDEAVTLARRFARTFDDFEYIVCPSGSCAAMVREHYAALDPAAGRLAHRVHELSRFIVDVLGVEDVGATYEGRVTYHPTCHSLRLLRIGDAPLRLLRNVRRLELIELRDAATCCGFGGTFAIKNPETSAAMLADKLAAIGASGAGTCTAVDNSCLLHIGGGLARAESDVRALHLAEILASAT
jgi:L-lactate dehydrogenase complex protein LldE